MKASKLTGRLNPTETAMMAFEGNNSDDLWVATTKKKRKVTEMLHGVSKN